jgi:hypothetical protein
VLGRRRFLRLMARGSAGLALLPFACTRFPKTHSGVLVNDIHSQLNRTRVHCVSRFDRSTADRRQVERCYPQMADFIKLKKKYDPHETFQSDWYRHYCHMFARAG